MTNAMSTDIEKRLGILRLRHKDPQGAAALAAQEDSVQAHQESLRRTQSDLVECTPGMVLYGRNERLQQQLRINLLAMRTFIPDMKLLTTALHIAAKQRDEAPCHADGHKTIHTTDLRSMKVGSSLQEDMAGAAGTVPRRFTDGGALLASPFKNTSALSVTAIHASSHEHRSNAPNPPPARSIPLEKLRNIEAIRDNLAREVGEATALLLETSASNEDLEATVAEVSNQLSKVQDEIEHKVSTYEALFQRSSDLQEQAQTAELTYRKHLTTNIQLADTWRSISKEIQKNDTTLKMLMDLAEARGAEGRTPLAEPESPTKKFKTRVKAMVNRKFTK